MTTQTKYEVANYREELARRAQAVLDVEVPRVNRINFKLGQIYVDGTAVGSSVCCYLLANRRVNSWYLNKYNPEAVEAPHCWSVFRKEDEVRAGPDENCVAPQSETCLNCIKNAYGSSRDGRKGKDCQNKRRLAIMPAGVPKSFNADRTVAEYDFLGVDVIKDATVYFATLPVTSGVLYEKYVRRISSEMGLPPFGVVTEIRCVPDPKTQFKVEFHFVAVMQDDAVGMEVMRKADIAEQEIGYGFEAPSAEQPKPEPVATGKF